MLFDQISTALDKGGFCSVWAAVRWPIHRSGSHCICSLSSGVDTEPRLKWPCSVVVVVSRSSVSERICVIKAMFGSNLLSSILNVYYYLLNTMPEVSEICQTVIRKESNERPKGRQGQAPVHFQPKQSVAGGDPVCCGVLARRWGGLVLGVV